MGKPPLNSIKGDNKKMKKFLSYFPSLSHSPTSKGIFHELFPSISITGKRCYLNCAHCSGKLLSLMKNGTSQEELVTIFKELKVNGGKGCLISGGCTPEGKVPINKFTDALKVAKDLGLKVVAHTGLVGEDEVSALVKANVDCVSMDVVGSENTINKVYNLKTKVSDINNSLKLLSDAGLKITPHILIGIHYGKILGEKGAIDLAISHNPDALIFIILTPIRGTLMENVIPPSPLQASKLIGYARSKLRDAPIVLGCMRPSGRYREMIDVLAVKKGVNGIAFPSKAVLKYIESIGFEAVSKPYCCSLISYDLMEEL